jgi:hypothetical protein
MKKFILLLTFFTLFMGTKNANAQAIYGPTTVCMDQVDGAGQPRAVTTYTVNHPLLCDYCKRGYNVEYTVQSGGTASEFLADCSTSGQIWNRVTTLTIVWTTPGTHVFTVGWKSCGVGYQGSSALSISVNVSNGIVNTSGNLAGTITNTALYPEPYVCSNNLSNFNINTDLSIGSCAASVSNQTLYLDRLNSTTGVWAQSVASATLPAGSSTRNMATIFGASNFTGVNNLNIYRVRGSVTSSAAGTKTFTTPNFRVISVAPFNVAAKFLARNGITRRARPALNNCANPMPVNKNNAPKIVGDDLGILNKYWFKIYKVSSTCPQPSAANLILDGSPVANRRLLPCNNFSCLVQDLGDYYFDVKVEQGADPNITPLNYFTLPANQNQIYLVEIWGENVCTGAAGASYPFWIINNSILSNERLANPNTINGIEVGVFEESALIEPNPNNGLFTLNYISADAQNTDLIIYNLQGQEVFKQNISAAKGENNIEYRLSDLPDGLYIYKIGGISNKFIKQ